MEIVNKSPDASGQSEDKKEAMRFRFERTFVTIRTELLAHFTEHGIPPDAVNWYRRVSLLSYIAQNMCLSFTLKALDYNVPGGKLSRGNSVVDIVRILKGRLLTDDEYLKAAVLGWSVEFVRF